MEGGFYSTLQLVCQSNIYSALEQCFLNSNVHICYPADVNKQILIHYVLGGEQEPASLTSSQVKSALLRFWSIPWEAELFSLQRLSHPSSHFNLALHQNPELIGSNIIIFIYKWRNWSSEGGEMTWQRSYGQMVEPWLELVPWLPDNSCPWWLLSSDT